MKSIRIFALTLVLTLALSASALAQSVQIAFGDNAIDTARTIKILESAGFLEADPAAGFSAELSDVTRYLYDIELVPITSTTLVGTLDDFTASFINNSYAVPSGLSPKDDAILREVQQEGSENSYRNILAVRTADLNSDFAQAILTAYQQQNVAEYLLLKYNYANLPAFDYDADFTVDESIVSLYDEYVSPKEGKTVVKIGVVGGNNDQFKVVQKNLDDAGAGLTIELVEFDLYNLPNDALHAGDIDLHACVTQAYFESDAQNQGFDDLSVLGYTLIAPLSLYSHKVSSVEELKTLAGPVE